MFKPKCPKCQSTATLAEMGSFWVGLDEKGELEGQWRDYESSTELTGKLLCEECGNQWEE